MTELLTADQWPNAADPGQARLGMERWRERAAQTGDAALDAFAAQLADDPRGRRMLTAIFGNSPHLTESALREIAFLRTLTTAPDPASVFQDLLTDANQRLAGETDRARLMAGLRRLKRQGGLLIALTDIGGLWPVEQVTAALSALAEATLRLACRQLLRDAAGRGALDLADADDPERGSGLIVLGMGKLGGKELNYSSDIDLIVLYDDAHVRTSKPDEMARTFVRLTRDLVRIMEERTADGYVFRTDLRLRPDPAATPLAVSVTAAESYYGAMAQNWERAAMIKARPVAGDIAAGKAFLRMLRPFVWRRSLDFAAIQDIHAIKRQINAHRGGGAIALEGHNVKLGRGGIREIEFFVQTQQLIFGGRDPRLRTAATVDGLDALAEQGRIDEDTARELVLAYDFLRRVEHRLQMVGDHQTHSIPEDPAAVDALGVFLGFDDPGQFRRHLRRTFERVEAHYAELFEEAPALPGPSGLNFSGADPDPDTVAALGAMGFANADAAVELVRGWLRGRYRATRSERARSLLTQLAPTLLDALARTPNPDTTLLRLDGFIGRLPAGIQIFSLFYANPQLLALVAELLGTSGRVADYLARNPRLLDAVLTPGFMERLPGPDALEEELTELLAAAVHYEDALDLVRRWTNDHRFRAAVHILRLISDPAECSAFLSAVAEAGLRALVPWVEAEFAQRHGGFGRSALAVVALGKLGSREMSPRSDLDLIMVYDAADIAAESDGPKPLPASVYYTRLIHRIVNAITAPTAEGALYEVDMRLRPSGSKGPVATGLEAFQRYHSESAWTWEHMALTRARVIVGPPDLQATLRDLIRTVLTAPREPEALLRDVSEMRARIERQFPAKTVWDVKYARGGLVDVEFVAQYLQLRHAHDDPSVLATGTAAALDRLAAAGLLAPDAAAALSTALLLCQRVQAYLRLTQDGPFDPEAASPALKAGLARAIFPDQETDFEGTEARLARALAESYTHVQALIGSPAPDPADDAQDGGGGQSR